VVEGFTDCAKRVVVLAQEEARMLNHECIGTEHLLLGLIREGESVAAKVLESLGIALEGVRQRVEEIIGQGQHVPSGLVPFTPRAKKTLELSLREAMRLGHDCIGTEHILLGLFREGEGVAAQVLVTLGADLNRVRQQVSRLLSKTGGRGEDRAMRVLSRRTKNNAVLIGEPGVTKAAVTEGSPQMVATRHPREILGVLLVDSPVGSVSGVCNRTGKPVRGTILVVDRLRPDHYDAVVAASAVICGRGGRTGHMQSLCRSRGIPVLRVDEADLSAVTDDVTIRLDRESVVLGELVPVPRLPEVAATTTLDDLDSICVVVADATDIEATNTVVPRVDSYFIREEFICLAADLSPIDALRAGAREAQEYGAAVGARLCVMAAELLPGQRLVMRLLDLRSDDAAQITTGVAVDDEPNPELGLHGARWLLAESNYPHAFRALRAHLRAAAESRVSFAVPFINDHAEFLRLRDHLGLTADTPLGVFIETPAAVHSTAEFCAAGASELFVGTKDLIQFYLAADRGNHLVAAIYQTRHSAVLSALRHAVESGRDAAVPVHVFALGADADHYVRHLPTRTLMMCASELRQLAGALLADREVS
jgi:pyruvate, water dikinase